MTTPWSEPAAGPDGDAIRRSVDEPAAFDAVFERHFQAVHAFAQRRVGRDLAEEVAAETFVRAFDGRARYDTAHGDALPWLLGITCNVMRRHWRTERRRLAAYARAVRHDAPVAAAAAPDVAGEALHAVARLPRRQREVLLLYAWADLTYEQVARALDLPVGTVRSRIARARTSLTAGAKSSPSFGDAKEPSVSDLELLRRLAPPVEPADPDVVDRAHARMADRRRRPLWRRGGHRRVLAAPIVAAAAIAVALLLTQTGGDDQPAWAAEVVRAAEASPRLLVDADGWKVTRVDEWAEGTGEMTFGNGQQQFDVRWMPGGDEAAQRNDKYSVDSQEHFETTVAGAHADVYRYDTQYSAIWTDADGNSVEAIGTAPTKQAFLDAVTHLEKVDVDAWLTALPASAVTPTKRDEAVTQIADGMPIPPGLDLEALRASGDATRDRYQLGAQIAGAVACGWIEQYYAGKKAGNAEQVAAAAKALGTAHDWPILNEMNAAGDYPEVVWEFTDAIVNNGQVPPESKVGKGKGVSIEESYPAALGCDVEQP